MKALVSAIVANLNGAHHLEVCLPTLVDQSYDPLEIIVVDNGSTDESEKIVRRWGVEWLPLGCNLGLAGALNQGAKASKGEFLLFLNNDTRFPPNFVQEMVKAIEMEVDIFAVDALQYDWEGKVKRHLAVFLLKRPGKYLHTITVVPGLYTEQKDVDNQTIVFQACAAAMLVRKDMFLSLGGFDARMPAGYEDTDICWRAWLRGWKTIFVPQAFCWHRVGASSFSPEGARVRFKGTLIGRLIFATKLLPINYLLMTLIYSIAGLFRDFKKHQYKLLLRLQVLKEYFSIFPTLIQERKLIYQNAQITPSEQLNRLLQLEKL
jgi:GT2 family glycosyltransferase